MKLQPDGQFTLPVDDNTAKVRPTGRDIALALSCSVLLMRWEQQQVVLTLVISLCMIVRDNSFTVRRSEPSPKEMIF
jgi:hypothetical protein